MNIDLEEFLSGSGIERAAMERWIENEWIILSTTAARAELTEIDAARAYLVRDLIGDFGVNDEGVEVALHLVDQIHGLRRVLFAIRTEISSTPLPSKRSSGKESS
ncbi:MAG TPA: chaperone modulator CbpM [Pseudoxanthomonas sp.]